MVSGFSSYWAPEPEGEILMFTWFVGPRICPESPVHASVEHHQLSILRRSGEKLLAEMKAQWKLRAPKAT